MSLTPFKVSYFNIFFIFSSSILIPSSPITTPKNLTFLTFYLYFFGFTYRLFYVNLLTTSSIISLCPSSSSIPTITLSMRLTTSSVLIKSYKILSIIVWNVTGELVSPKNITISSNDPFRGSWISPSTHLSPLFIYYYILILDLT